MNMIKVDALMAVNDSMVQEFHNKRLLFVIYGEGVYCEKKPSGLSHIDWFKTLDIDEDPMTLMNKCVRGYYFDKLVFYKGINFDYDDCVVEAVRHHLTQLADKLDIKYSTLVGLGTTPSDKAIFDPKYIIGTIRELINDGIYMSILKRIK